MRRFFQVLWYAFTMVGAGVALAFLLFALGACSSPTEPQQDVCIFDMRDGVSRDFTASELTRCRLVRFVAIDICEP